MLNKTIKNYKDKQNEIDEIIKNNKINIKEIIISILLSLFIISAPLLILINLLIFVDYLKLTIYGIIICASLLYMFFLKFIYDFKEIKDTKIINIFNFSIILLILTVIYLFSFIWW